MKVNKFRAWDKKNGMWFPDSLIFDSFGHVRMCFQHNNLPEDTRIKSNVTSDPSPTLMQYTGLKDKNGVEIYEGDIITIVDKASDWTEEVSRDKFGHFIVEWSEVLAGWYPKSLNGYEPDETWWQTWEVEVIGNIYENPQLLAGGDRG